MNRVHHWLCRSERWRKELEANVVPWVLGGVALGSNVLEVGPGPGLTTDILRSRVAALTALEIDSATGKFPRGQNAWRQCDSYSGRCNFDAFRKRPILGALCFTMLHHVPSPALQDKLLGEVFRVLQPGGMVAGTDGLTSTYMKLIHLFDTLVPINPATFQGRLQAAGFEEILVEANPTRFRFRARKPV